MQEEGSVKTHCTQRAITDGWMQLKLWMREVRGSVAEESHSRRFGVFFSSSVALEKKSFWTTMETQTEIEQALRNLTRRGENWSRSCLALWIRSFKVPSSLMRWSVCVCVYPFIWRRIIILGPTLIRGNSLLVFVLLAGRKILINWLNRNFQLKKRNVH